MIDVNGFFFLSFVAHGGKTMQIAKLESLPLDQGKRQSYCCIHSRRGEIPDGIEL